MIVEIKKPADLARLVKVRRQALGHTQQSVADAARVTRQSVARIERGNAAVSFHTLLLIFDFLEIRLTGAPIDTPLELGNAPDELRNSTTPEQRVDDAVIGAVNRFLQSNLERGDPETWDE